MDGALVRLVQHDAGVAAHLGVDQRLPQQHTVRHVLDLCLRRGAVLEPDRVADLLTQPEHSQGVQITEENLNLLHIAKTEDDQEYLIFFVEFIPIP